MNKQFTIQSEQELNSIIQAILPVFNNLPVIIILEGNLGAGKTTFVQYLAKYLGYKDIVNSPTFGKLHEYITDKYSIYHIDCYRECLSSEQFEELLEINNSIICIEWFSLFETYTVQDLKSAGLEVIEININRLENEERLLFIK